MENVSKGEKMKKIFFIIALGVVLFLTGCGKTVEIKFDSNGGSEITTIVKAGDFDPNNLPTPEKAGYEFIGWYLDTILATPIMGNVPKNLKFTLYAKWQGLNQVVKLEHYLEDLDGSYHLEKTDDLTFKTGEVVNANAGSYTGYEHNQNHSSSVLSLTVSASSNNILKVYYNRKIVKIIIDEAGGDAVSDLTGKYGSTVTPPTLNRVGYEFDGWEQEFPTTMPTSDLTLKAKWKALVVNYKVEYYLENANDNNYTLIETIEKTEYTDTLVTAETKSYTGFNEFVNHPDYLASAKVLGNASLVLKVYFNRNVYQIAYLPNGGSEVSTENVKYGAQIFAAVSLKTGYEFNHWFLTNEDEAYNFDTMPLNDLTLTAKWTKIIYKISFETNADISVVSITAAYEDVIQAPTPPLRLGYNFIDWYEDQELKIPYVFTTMPAKNFTLYGKWEPLPYTMEFDSNSGSIITPIIAPVGTIVEKPIPTLPGHDFINWYRDPDYINEYNDWVMPVGGIKLYAKWSVKSFTLTFETNGGSPVDPITAPYLYLIDEPVWPTKEGYLFDGWYEDSEFKILFTFDSMPLNGGTIYVRWLDEANKSQISYVLRQETFSYLGVKGTVFAKNNSDYRGFYLFDHSGFIYIDADHSLVNLGDLVYLEGYLNPFALINGISNLEIITSNNQISAPEMISYDDLDNYQYLLENNFKYLSISGVLINEEGHYYLYDYQTNQQIKLDHRTYQQETIAAYVNQYVTVDFVLIFDYHELLLGVVNIDNSVNTTENKTMITSELLAPLNMVHMLPGDSFDLTKYNRFGWAEITWVATGDNASLYDEVSRCFLPTETNKLVDFLVEINIGGQVATVPITIMVGPAISIAEFLTLLPGTYHLQAIVVMKLDFNNIIILKDNSGTIILNLMDDENIEIGDELAVTLEKQQQNNRFYEYQVISTQVLQTNLELNNPPRLLSKEEVNTLSKSLEFMNGEYVEVRGFAQVEYYDFYIEIGGYKYPILPGSYIAYENIDKYLNHEVQLRGYLINLSDELFFIFMNNRGDIQIPTYSDQELVNYLQEAFIKTYSGKVFHPYDFFECHNNPFYPATISWEMDSETTQYFNFENEQFQYVDHIVDLNIDITITMNDASLTFRYHTTLEPLKISTAAEFKAFNHNQPVFIEGIVVYHHPNYVYLLVDGELIFVNINNIDIYVGDQVILYGLKKYHNYNYGEAYLEVDNDSYLPVVIEIISRGNSFDLTSTPMTIDEIYQLDSTDSNSYTQYIEVSGTLIQIGFYQYCLSRGNQRLLIDYVDEYTMYNQLQPYLYTEVTLHGFISNFNEYQEQWAIRFHGQSNEVECRPYTNLEKVNLIREFYYNAYNNYNYSFNYIIFSSTHPNYGGQIVYESFGDNASVFDFNNGTVAQVSAITPVDIRATITLGDVTETFTFVVYVMPNTSSMTLMTINEVLNAALGDLVAFQGLVIGIHSDYPNSYFLLYDETGVIYVRTSSYFFDYNNVGRVINLTGTVEIVRGRKQVFNDTSYTALSNATPTQEFIPTSYLELLNYDNYEQSIYGKPVVLTGKLIVRNYSDFYLTNGYDEVRLTAFETNALTLRNYNGYQVQIKGFYLGNCNNYDNKINIIVAKHYSYGTTIALDNYSDEEIVNLTGEYLLNHYQEDELWDIDQLSLITSHPVFLPTITYDIISGSEYAFIDGNMLKFYDLSESVEIVLQITVSFGSFEKVFTKMITVNDFALHSLDDLFALVPGTPDIRLQAIVIYQNEDYTYFLIDEKIYYLEGYYFESLMVNSEVYITGKKTIIDGIADYSYQIETIHIQEEVMYDLLAEPMTIEEIYANDFSLNNLSEKYLEVFGRLHYDMVTEMFYLEDSGYRIYIRSPRDIYERSYYYNDLAYFNGEEVYLKLLFPNKFVYGTYYMLDFMNSGDDLSFPELTITEHLDCAINDLHNFFSEQIYYPSDYINIYEYNGYHQVSYQYSLENELDSEFISLENYRILIVEEVKVIRFIVQVIYDEENFQETMIELTIHPLPVSTIRDVLWGERYQNYFIEGIVQGYHEDRFVIVKDATGMIYVEIVGCVDQTNVEVGALVQIIGYRDYYRNSELVPILYNESQVKVISLNHEVIKVPEEMNFCDIIAIDYLNPDSYVKYIEISGKVVFTGNTYYPSFAILDETSGTSYKLEMVGQTYYEFNEMMKTYLDQNITVSGWLTGMDYFYSEFSWYLVYDSHLIQP